MFGAQVKAKANYVNPYKIEIYKTYMDLVQIRLDAEDYQLLKKWAESGKFQLLGLLGKSRDYNSRTGSSTI